MADQRGRLARLIKYTSGDAKELIKLCIHDDPIHCYDNAFSLLDKEYGNPNRVSSKFLKQLRELPAIKITDTVGLKKIHLFLLKCQVYRKKGGLQDLDSAPLIRSIIAKLDMSYQENWRARAESTRRDKKREPSFNDFVNFIDFQACSANDPSYSREVMKDVKCYKVHFEEVTCFNCPFCNTDESPHSANSCPTLLDKSVSERYKLIFSNRLCFGCLKPISNDHYGKICSTKLKCSTCGKPHPTCLHEDSTVQIPECNKNLEKAKALAIQQISDSNSAVGLCIVPVYISHPDSP